MPGPRRAARARRTSRTWSRCIGNTPRRAWPSSRSRSTTRPTKPPSPRPRSSSRTRRPSSPMSCSTKNSGDGFEKLNIGAIPAVFVFGPDGKEVKRFTMDDPNNQFTYDEVEKAVVALLGESYDRVDRQLHSEIESGIHERRNPSQVSGKRRHLRMREFVQHAQHQGQDHGRGVLQVPSVLHRIGEVRRCRRRVDKFNKKFQGTYGKGKTKKTAAAARPPRTLSRDR